MSRIGKRPVPVPEGVEVSITPSLVAVRGPKGSLEQYVSPDLKITSEEGQVVVERPTDRGHHRALHGLTRSLIANMVQGVTEGFEKRLEIQGVGYRARGKGASLELSLGFSHPVVVDPPEGIELQAPAQNHIIIRGIDKQQVGEVAARIRKLRPPEPYKGKGIRYEGEDVLRKVGKRA